jgi:putative flavoprotein involved in K+ transport
MNEHDVGTLVIGAGQAGLAIGYHLRRSGLPFVIVDENDRVGNAWRKRWDSLRLFTPAPYNGLPGMPFPGPTSLYPTKDEAADYLEAYARKFELPVRTGIRVDRLRVHADRFEASCGAEVLSAANVVVATGAYHQPRVPAFAATLNGTIYQIHSSEYRNLSQLREGAVLVVGAGNSGAEIAMELARHHRTWLSGPDTGQEPARAGSIPDRFFTPIMWLVATRLTVRTKLGRRLRDHFLDPPRGIPLARVRRKDIVAAGIERVGRTTGVREGHPLLEDGRVLEVSNVIWCTGYAPDFGWIDCALPTRHGFPIHDRGVIESVPGLYFMGLLFQYSLSSVLVGGVGRDAKHIADHIASRQRRRKVPIQGLPSPYSLRSASVGSMRTPRRAGPSEAMTPTSSMNAAAPGRMPGIVRPPICSIGTYRPAR